MKTVTQYIVTELNLTGKYWPTLIDSLLALSAPERDKLHNFLCNVLSQVRVFLSTASSQVEKFDYVSDYINKLHTALTEALSPVEQFLYARPVDAVLLKSPLLVDLYQEVMSYIPIKIPAAVSDALDTIVGADFLDGIYSFHDLKDKIDELAFKAARVTSLRTYSEGVVFILNNYIEKIKKICDILVMLEY